MVYPLATDDHKKDDGKSFVVQELPPSDDIMDLLLFQDKDTALKSTLVNGVGVGVGDRVIVTLGVGVAPGKTTPPEPPSPPSPPGCGKDARVGVGVADEVMVMLGVGVGLSLIHI